MFMISYFIAMFITYPAPGPQVPQFNNFYTAFKGLLDLALIGQPMDLVIFEGEAEPGESHLSLNPWDRTDLYLFVAFYYMYVLVAVVLLLNLLIALMGNTFTKVQEDAVLQEDACGVADACSTPPACMRLPPRALGNTPREYFHSLHTRVHQPANGGSEDGFISLATDEAAAGPQRTDARHASARGQIKDYPCWRRVPTRQLLHQSDRFHMRRQRLGARVLGVRQHT